MHIILISVYDMIIRSTIYVTCVSSDELSVLSVDCLSLLGRGPVSAVLTFCGKVADIADTLATHCGLVEASHTSSQVQMIAFQLLHTLNLLIEFFFLE